MNSQRISEDILNSLFSLHGVNEVDLLMAGIGELNPVQRKMFIERIKEDFELISPGEDSNE